MIMLWILVKIWYTSSNMETVIVLLLLLILAETSFLLIKNHKPIIINNKRKVFIDTCVLIDGRILNIAKTNLLNDDLIILKSVISELQLLADGKDNYKRNRARTGLDNLNELERCLQVNVQILDDGPGRKSVDDQLLAFAKEQNGAIMTLDYNLIKVAKTQKIATLNINDLSLATRIENHVGQKCELEIIAKGSEKGQGIGYLPDGLLVVVKNASNKVGKKVTVEILKSHESSSGNLLFAKITK